ncbi:ABC transporter substrate-binding protein [Arthrobacter sp. MI7-26]|uniref:ABC transporter substrate-binding protein n=1 Tax=Arthrobacter sp. MI7-26 TaxID=2993653 RepID=UPI002248B34A|nr:ABC transporter substrate-binding protein [Arthrobacter sp. MI7-26]
MLTTPQIFPHAPGTRSTRRPPRRRTLTITALLAAGSLALTACAPAVTTTGKTAAYELTGTTPAPSGQLDSFTWSIYAEPSSLDYAHAYDFPDDQVLSNVCESLLRTNPDLSISPGLAAKWENPTPTTWVYTIRSGVTFHDGTPLTAADVVASLKRHVDPAVGSPWAVAFANVSSIEQTSGMEVTVTTSTPDSQFNLAMASIPGEVESAATLAKDGANYGNAGTGVNCTGPFSLEKWDSGSSITLKRYDAYWDKTLLAKSKQVKFVFLSDPNTRINAFKSGEVDGGWLIPSNAIDQLKASPNGKLYFGLNTTVADEVVSNMSGPLGDQRVRKALMMAIDRRGLVAAGEQGYAKVTDALTTRSVWNGAQGGVADNAFNGLESYPVDIAAAKKLVADAGATDKEIVIATSPIYAGADVVAQAVAAAATSIGLKPRIDTIPPAKYTTLFTDPAARKGIDLFFTMWNNSIADPLEMYAVLRTGEASNYGGWSNPDFDATVNKAIGISDPTDRARESTKAQHIANTELPWLPLYEVPTTVWLGSRITGVSPSISYLYSPWAAAIGAN